MNVIINFLAENFWATAASLGVIATMIAGVINGWFNPNKVWKQVIAWLVSIGLTVGSYFMGLIHVAEPTWLTLTATGLIVGLVSNGIYDIPTMQNFIAKLFHELPDNK